MSHLVFVYGTLKEGFPNFGTNTGQRFGGDYETAAKFPLYLNGERQSPCMVNERGKGEHVRGQVFSLDDDGLARMDRLERVAEADGYRRHRIEVLDPDSLSVAPLSVWIYLKEAALVRDISKGPLSEYTHEDAKLYRPREQPLSP